MNANWRASKWNDDFKLKISTGFFAAQQVVFNTLDDNIYIYSGCNLYAKINGTQLFKSAENTEVENFSTWDLPPIVFQWFKYQVENVCIFILFVFMELEMA